MKQGKKSLYTLFFIFLAPVILGTIIYFNKEKLGIGSNTVNYGTLVTPASPLQIEGLSIAGKVATKENVLSKKWTLLFIAPNECDAFCKDRLLLMKNVRLLMNENMRRIRTVLISSNPALEDTLKKDNSNLVFANVESSSSVFLTQFKNKKTMPIYMIDPLGNLMMFYPQPKPNHKMMIKDLKRLLKYSRIG